MANKIQIKRGLESNINKSNLSQGELAVTTDSNKLYVGTSKGPIQLNKGDESTTNKVTTITKDSTDDQYPTAKAVYTMIGDVESQLGGI